MPYAIVKDNKLIKQRPDGTTEERQVTERIVGDNERPSNQEK